MNRYRDRLLGAGETMRGECGAVRLMFLGGFLRSTDRMRGCVLGLIVCVLAGGFFGCGGGGTTSSTPPPTTPPPAHVASFTAIDAAGAGSGQCLGTRASDISANG